MKARGLTQRIVQIVMLSALLLGLLVNFALVGQQVKAANGKVDFTIKKNDGLGVGSVVPNDNVGTEFDQSNPVNGAVFKVFDITNYFYDRLNATSNSMTAPELAKDITVDYAAAEGSDQNPTVLDPTGEAPAPSGQVSFQLNEKSPDDNGNYAVYLIRETTTPKGYVGSVPMVVALSQDLIDQAENSGGITLYPKNYLVTKTAKIGNNLVPDAGISVEVGTKIDYEINFTVPSDIARVDNNNYYYDSLDLTEEMKNADFPTTGVTVETNDATLQSTIQQKIANNVAGGGWEISLLVSELQDSAGEIVKIKYSVTTTEAFIADRKLSNTFTLELKGKGNDDTNTEVVEAPDIWTGGFRAVKLLDGNPPTSGSVVETAKFALRRNNSDGTYSYMYFVEQGRPNLKKIKWESALPTLTQSDKTWELAPTDEGELDLSGLAYGSYSLVEIKAPDGYTLPTGNSAIRDVAVGRGSYYTFDTNGDETDNKGDVKEINNLKNIDGILPETGSAGFIIMLIVGLMLVMFAYMMKQRDREDA